MAGGGGWAVGVLVTVFCPLLKQIYRQTIPEIALFLQSFCCGCPYEEKSKKQFYHLSEHFCYGLVKLTIHQRLTLVIWDQTLSLNSNEDLRLYLILSLSQPQRKGLAQVESMANRCEQKKVKKQKLQQVRLYPISCSNIHYYIHQILTRPHTKQMGTKWAPSRKSILLQCH